MPAFTGDVIDHVGTQTAPPDEDISRLEAGRTDGVGAAPTTGFSFKMVLLDGSGDPVAPGTMTYDVEILEVDQMELDDGSFKKTISAGESQTGAAPYQQFSAPGFSGSTVGGGIFLRLTNLANVPGAAAELQMRIRNL